MSDLGATNCGGCGCNEGGCNSILWIIILLRLAAVVITADSVATTDVAVEMTAYGSSYFFSAVADVVTETASANRRQTSMGDLKFP